MAFTNYPIDDLGKGLDTYSSKDGVAEGFSSELKNIDPRSNKTAALRKGYQRYYGGVPLRVQTVSKSGTTITLEFDSSQTITLATAGSGPLLISGKIPGIAGGGDFSTTFNSVWYRNYDLSFRESFPSGTDQTKEKTAGQTGFTTDSAFVGISEATDLNGVSNTYLWPGETRINKTTFTPTADASKVIITYTAPDTFKGYVYYLERPADPGTTYIETFVAKTSVTILASTHGLVNTNIIPLVQVDEGDYYVTAHPDDFTLADNGDVTVTFSTATTGKIILTVTDADKSATFSASPGFNTLTIPSITDPFNFLAIWADSGVTKSLVIPEDIRWDEASSSIEIDYRLGDLAAESVEVFWIAADYSGNVITVEDTTGTSESYSISEPQLSAYGLPHEGIYKDPDSRGGHVTHIDAYQTEGVNRIICGLGGNIFQATSYEEGGSDYLMPRYKLTGARRVSGDFNLAPLFQPSGSSVSRTRGIITDDSIVKGATVTSVDYVSTGVVDYTMTFTSKDLITWGQEIDDNDFLTITNCSKSINNGTFKILSIQEDSTTTCVLRVSNTSAKSRFLNEASIKARANVYTDKVTLTAVSIFIEGDQVASSALSTNKPIKSSDGTSVYIGDVTSAIIIPDGVNLFLKRTCSVLPLADNFNANTDNLVRGDLLRVSGLERRVRIKQVNTNDSQQVTVVVASGVGTVTLTNHAFNPGDTIILYNGPEGLTGKFTISEVTSTSVFTITTTAEDGTFSPYIQGHTIEIDEALEYTTGPNQTDITVDGRWTSVEIPNSTQERAVKTKKYNFDESAYSDQPYIRSTVVSNSMFFTNGVDDIRKYDGVNLTKAGIPTWQPWAFISVDTTTGSLPAGQTITCSAVNVSEKYFEFGTTALQEGDVFKESVGSNIFTVSRVTTDTQGTNAVYRAYVVEDIPGGLTAGTVTLAKQLRYYVRVSLIDRNSNIVASATLGSDDLNILYFQSSSVSLKLIGFPPTSEIDYDKIEISLFRTRPNTVAPFYAIQTLLVDYEDHGGWILIHDTTPDDSLVLTDIDPVTTALVGSELGNTWNHPPRAEAITTAGNSLILGGIKSPPTLDVVFRRIGEVAVTELADYTGSEVMIEKSDTASEDFNNKIVFSFETTTVANNTITPTTDLTIDTDSIVITTGSAHGLSDGDWVYLFHSAIGLDKHLDFSGWYRVDATTSTTFTIFLSHNRTVGAGEANDIDTWIASSSTSLTAPLRVPVWLGTDGNFNQRGYQSVTLETLAAARLGVAINAVMATESPSNSYWVDNSLTPTPWLRALSGLSFASGQLVIYDLNEPNGSISIKKSGATNVRMFVNGTVVPTNTWETSIIRVFGSRVAASYPNFPEIFDDTYSAQGGDRVVDIDPANGQNITTMVPFFGQSAFGAAQLAQSVVVFKTQSIYLLDINTFQYQKIQSQGQGCTAPRSVTIAKDGIMFANDSGIYRLGWDMKVSWVGMAVNDTFKKERNLSRTSEIVGHNYSTNRQYKLSFPSTNALYNTNVLVYDFSREEIGQMGAWGEYTNHPAIGWSNLQDKSYFASTKGLVFQIRDTSEKYDYRDDDQAIDTPSLITGGIHFGLPGERKSVAHVILQMQNEFSNVEGIEVLADTDLSGDFQSCGDVEFNTEDQTVKFTLPNRRGVYFRIKITLNAPKDMAAQFSKIIFATSAIGSTVITPQKSLTDGN